MANENKSVTPTSDTSNTTETKEQSIAAPESTSLPETLFVRTPQKQTESPAHWWSGFVSPIGALFLAVVLMASLLSFGIGASLSSNASSDTSNSNGNTMNSTSGTQAAPANVPDATQDYGNQPAHYVIDPAGAKHFTFTAEQVMWEVVNRTHRIRQIDLLFTGRWQGPPSPSYTSQRREVMFQRIIVPLDGSPRGEKRFL